MVKLYLLFSIVLILSISLISAIPFPTPEVSVGIGFQESIDSGVNIFIPEPEIFDNDTLQVDHAATAGTADFANAWNTDIGILNSVNDTQFDEIGNDLTIKESWLITFGNAIWCALTGCTMEGDIDMDTNNIFNVSNITLQDSIKDSDTESLVYFNANGTFVIEG